jgi:hypothetical protein
VSFDYIIIYVCVYVVLININNLGKIFKIILVCYNNLQMETIIDYKRLYELSIIEKEKILTDNQKKQEKINELTEELNSYKIENYSKKNYYQKNKEKIIEKVKEYNKNYVKTPEQIKEYNKRAYEKRKAKKIEEQNL